MSIDMGDGRTIRVVAPTVPAFQVTAPTPSRTVVVPVQGPPGPGAHRLLAFDHAPLSGSGLDALDGDSDPWRWWPTQWDGWIGPAYHVTWQTGDVIPVLTLPDGADLLRLDIAPGSTPKEVDDTPGNEASFHDGIQNNANEQVGTLSTSGPLTAIEDGTGIAFLIQVATGNAHTTVPDPDLDITTMLGDVTVGDPYEWDETGDGVDTDFALDTTTGELYGPKAGGVWGPPGWILPTA